MNEPNRAIESASIHSLPSFTPTHSELLIDSLALFDSTQSFYPSKLDSLKSVDRLVLCALAQLARSAPPRILKPPIQILANFLTQPLTQN